MSRGFLLDTNVLSEPARKRPDAGVLENLRKNEDRLFTTSVVWHELSFGCKRLQSSRRRRRLEAYLETVVRGRIPILPYDEQAADWHSQERARLERCGRTPTFVDGTIAAVAHVHGLVLVTANVKDYSKFAGIDVVNWRSQDMGIPLSPSARENT